MLYLLVSFFVAAVVTLLVIHSSRSHAHLSADADLSGPQKFHATPVPRIGGMGMFTGLACCVGVAAFAKHPDWKFGALLVVCGLPAFLAGLIEDLTKRVSPAKRLVATAASAALGIWLLGGTITRTDIPGLDLVVATTAGAWIATVFTVAGVANSLGDGGAYFLGFYLAEIGILLIARNPEVSPLFPLMVCIYPVFETLFSMYRRKVIRAVPTGLPDGIHLHSLIYRRLMRWAIGARDARAMTRRNSMTAPYLWMLCVSSLVPALVFWDSTPMIVACMALFGLTYVALYRRIVRFKTPKWLVVNR
ncbi:MAG: glycosyltransferase family 4 protein [Burkholderiales bacterium]|nr:glycosyltransferase family 4 protein [Burkholderiales bacterium]